MQVINEKTKEILEKANKKKYNKWLSGMRNATKALDKSFTFKGKVIDFNGKPIHGAVVTLSISGFDPKAEFFRGSKKQEIPTDEDGVFVFRGKAISLAIKDITKKGYEFRLENSDYTYFEFDNKLKQGYVGQPSPYDPSDNKIAVFKIRKRAVIDYLLKSSFGANFSKSKNAPFRPNLFGKWIDSYGKEMNLSASKYEKNKPIEISCQFNSDFSAFTLIFEATFEDSVVYLSKELLYEAPTEGYQKKLICTYNMKDESGNGNQGLYDVPLFLYVKGPGGSYYSRIDLLLRTSPLTTVNKDASVRIGARVYTNPEGNSYLEYDPDFVDSEKRKRHDLSERYGKMRRDEYAKYHIEKKQNKNTPKPDEKK